MITIEEQMRNDTLKFIKLINKLLDNHRKKLRCKQKRDSRRKTSKICKLLNI
jgi:hypothetical protein